MQLGRVKDEEVVMDEVKQRSLEVGYTFVRDLEMMYSGIVVVLEKPPENMQSVIGS